MSDEIAQIVLKASDVLTKKDFEGNFKKVLELVMKLIQRHEEAIRKLMEDNDRRTEGFKQDYTSNLSELRKQVNQLFVEERLKQMDTEQKASARLFQKMVSEAVDRKLQEADDKVSQLKPIKGDKGDKGDTGPMPTEHLELMKGMMEEMKKVQNILSNIPRGKSMGRAKVQITRRVDLTSQVDGSTRSFTLPPDTVAVLGIQGSQFPFTMADADLTLRGNILTLGNQVATPAAGQTLVALLDVLFYP